MTMGKNAVIALMTMILGGVLLFFRRRGYL